MKSWYQLVDHERGTEYYTPYRRSAELVEFVNDGSKTPSPREIVDFLRKNPPFEYHSGGFFISYDSFNSHQEACELPSGCYIFESHRNEAQSKLIPFKLREDHYVRAEMIHDHLVKDISDFLKGEEVYRSIGVQYRRGILLYGPPGNGKTTCIRNLLRTVIPDTSVIIFLNEIPKSSFLLKISESLKDRLKVFVFEEFTTLIKTSQIESVLSFLDGETSIDRTLILATTNYPENLPRNIVDRPSRFDRLVKYPNPSEEIRKTLLSHFLGPDFQITSEDIRLTHGLSVVALREIALLVRIRGFSILRATHALKNHREIVKREFSELNTIGFDSSDSDPY